MNKDVEKLTLFAEVVMDKFLNSSIRFRNEYNILNIMWRIMFFVLMILIIFPKSN